MDKVVVRFLTILIAITIPVNAEGLQTKRMEERKMSEVTHRLATKESLDSTNMALGLLGKDASLQDIKAAILALPNATQAAADNANAAAAAATTAAGAISGMIAETYSSSATYEIGDYVYYNGNLYRAIAVIDAPEAWTAAHWELVPLGNDVKNIKKSIDEILNYENIFDFFETVSGTREVDISAKIPAGNYLIKADSIVSSDTDESTSRIMFLSGGNVIQSVYATRTANYSGTVTLASDVDEIRFFAANSYDTSAGDTFAFTNIRIYQNSDLYNKIYTSYNALPYRDFDFTGKNGSKLIDTVTIVTTNPSSCTIKFASNAFITWRGVNNGYYYDEKTGIAGQSFTIENTKALVYDVNTKELSIASMAYGGYSELEKTKVVLISCMFGYPSSPVPSIMYELKNRYCYYASAIGSGGKKMIKTISESGNDRTVVFANDVLILCEIGGEYEYHSIISADTPITINNAYGLVWNPNTDTLSQINIMGNAKPDGIVILANMWGKIISHIGGLSEELYDYYFDNNKYNTTTVVITPDNSEFCQIRNAINEITDASKTNRYRLFIKNGTYQEIDIVMKDFVDLVGESVKGVVLNCNGLSSETTPEDYSTEGYGNQTISSIPKHARHLMRHMANATVSNITLQANDVKYINHQDGESQPYTAVFDGCIFIRDDDLDHDSSDYDRDLQNLIGVGAIKNQFQIYRNCVFIKKIANLPENADSPARNCAALLWHNWNNQTEPCGAMMENCSVIGCNIASLFELGSEQPDVVQITNTKASDPMFGILYSVSGGYYKIGGVAVPKEDVPYCLRVDISGENPSFVLLTDGRYEGYKETLNAYTESVFETSGQIKAGQPVTIPNFMNKKSSVASAGDFAFALETTNGGFFYANTGHVGNGLMAAGSYTFKTPVYINNGYFTTVENGNIVGYIFKDTTLSAEGFVPIIKAD